jgi:hypothetical protein
VYANIAWRLTESEYPRTETAFETSYTLKMYIFQFVNYYATLFYLAFIQPWLAGKLGKHSPPHRHCAQVTQCTAQSSPIDVRLAAARFP